MPRLVGIGVVLILASGPAEAQDPPSAAAAVRFLKQATFGPTWDAAAQVQETGFEAFLDEQFAAETIPYPEMDLRIANPNSCDQIFVPAANPAECRRDFYTMYLLQQHFYGNTLYGGDQLRQRVAWALSQFLVTSGLPPLQYAFWIRPYQQLLYQGAFGNFRQLLRDVTLHPTMGNYLDMAGNRCQTRTPPDPNVCRNGLAVKPNENYARELLQLFSIGTVLLNQDGTPVLDEATGQPIPSYDQDTVEEFSRALTGWVFAPVVPSGSGCIAPGVQNCPNYRDPMIVRVAGGFEDYHDKGPKTLLNGFELPGGQSAAEELEAVLDNIMDHQNTAPYVSKLLIKNLVTSNPSPGYVKDVADVFVANRGSDAQLQEVVRAILLHPEAREDVPSDPRYGHLHEPVLAMTSFLRAFGAESDAVLGSINLGGAYQIGSAQLDQDVFRAPSVFNYYSPEYQVPGEEGVLGPEFEIYSSMMALRRANFYNKLLGLGTPAGIPAGGDRPSGTFINLDGYYDLAASDPAGLVGALNTLLMNESMSSEMFDTLTAHVSNLANPAQRVQHAIYLIVTSAQFQVER